MMAVISAEKSCHNVGLNWKNQGAAAFPTSFLLLPA